MKNFIAFRGKKVYYQVTGKGPVIVLLHGFLASGEVWKNFARKLRDDFRIIIVDLHGHGQSEALGPPGSLDEMAEAVNHIMKAEKISHCMMAGHSMGGYVTLAFAEKYPKKLKGFVLFHSHAASDSPEVSIGRKRTIALVEKDRQGFIHGFIPGLFDPENVHKFKKEIDRLRQLAANMPKEGIITSLEAMKNRPDRQHVVLNSKVPVLFIIGKNDNRIRMEDILPQALLPEHSEILLLDHVGHMGFIEAPGKTFDVVTGFARRVMG
jgi:pimeloyl-ACP methyl ester carboxylesterase